MAGIVSFELCLLRNERPCGGHQISQQEQWQVSGSAPEVYERELVPAVFGPWAPILIELVDLKQGDRVIDIACGTGMVQRSPRQGWDQAEQSPVISTPVC